MNWRHSGTGPAALAICAALATAGSSALPAAAPSATTHAAQTAHPTRAVHVAQVGHATQATHVAQIAHTTQAAQSTRAAQVAHVAALPPPAGAASKACAGATRSNPVGVTLAGMRAAYAAGGRWSTVRLTLHNGTHTVCAQLKPVLVYGARNKTLRVDALRLESRLGGHWRRVTLNAALGELVGAVGPTAGLRLHPGQTKTLTVRMRVARGAPHGEWLSLAVAYAPLQNKGTTVAWPVGVTNPAYFRVVAAHTRTRTT